MDVDFVSGGERREFFLLHARGAAKLGLGHLSIFKDLSSVYTDANGVSMPAEQASLSGKRSVHIADLVTVASSYIRAWIPAVEGLGAKIACSLAVVDRDHGGSKILADAGWPAGRRWSSSSRSCLAIAHKMGRITDKQLALVLHFIDDPDAFMRSFLLAHPDFLADEIAKAAKAPSAHSCAFPAALRPPKPCPKPDAAFASTARSAALPAVFHPRGRPPCGGITGLHFVQGAQFSTASPFQGTGATRRGLGHR